MYMRQRRQGILGPVPSLHIVYATTSGHTEYVMDVLIAELTALAPSMEVKKQLAEKTSADDLKRGDALLLASSTWNTGNVEGQLNPHMHALLLDRAKDISLSGKGVALVALGDERYFHTANAAVHLEKFAATHQGRTILPTLKIINEPYGQEEAIRAWAKQLVPHLLNPL